MIISALAVSVIAGCTAVPSPGPAPTEETAETQTPSDATGEPSATGEPHGDVTADPGETDPSATEGETSDPNGTEGPSEDASASPSDDGTASPGSTEDSSAGTTPTEKPTETAKWKGPGSATDVIFDASDALDYFKGPNATKAELVADGDYGHVVKLSTTGKTNDPFITFNYRSYLGAYGISPVSADTYRAVALRIKQEKCSNSSFELFYCAGSVTSAVGGYSRTGTFDNTDTDWQYVVYDLSSAGNYKGTVNAFRFDYMYSAASAGETVYIGEVILAKTLEEIIGVIGGGGDINALSSADQKRAEELIRSAKDNAPAVSNAKINASNEDGDITLWFDHSFAKTPEEVTSSTGRNTYQIRMAKNEIEDCQFILVSSKAKSGLTAKLTEFTDGSGNKLSGEILEGYYFSGVEGKTIVDPIPPLKGSFDLKAGKSKTFLIKVRTSKTTKAGQYSAVLTIEDKDGKEIKKANVYVYVWNFALPEASSCKILADLSWWNIYSYNPPWLFSGDDSLTYAKYYDYLLENKVNAYNLPYLNSNKDDPDPFSDPRINKYLDDPRVQAFNPVGFGTDRVTETRVKNAYTYLSQKPEWLKKAYFYPVDEPETKSGDPNHRDLDTLITYAKLIKKYFGKDYKLIAPMHKNFALNSDSTVDHFKYVEEYVNVWCPHNYFFNTLADYKNDPRLMFSYYTALLEKNLGSFKSRMEKEQAGGDEVWWYVTRFPHHPEITLSIDDSEIEHRLMFWQQKLYDIDGFLYYMVNDWFYGGDNPWDKKNETAASPFAYNVYGNGVLVYNGFEDPNGQPYQGRDHANATYESLSEEERKNYNAYPVGSMRLESVRDGADDYDYFTMLDKLYGDGTSDLIIKQMTTSLGRYKLDGELYNSLRIAVGNLIASRS